MFMATRGRKIFTVYESPGGFAEISELESLFEAMPGIETEEQMEVEAVDFADFWTEQAWEDAVVAANSADLIVVSLSGGAELPMPVQRWMETWPCARLADQKTLVVVFTAERSGCPKQAALTVHFQKIAERHGLEFICNHAGTPEPADLRRIDPMRFMRELVLPHCTRLWSSSQPFQRAAAVFGRCAQAVPELNQ